MDAVAFAQLPPAEMRYSHVLLKELVHHIPAGESYHDTRFWRET